MGFGFFGKPKEQEETAKKQESTIPKVFQSQQKTETASQQPYPEADYDLPDEFADRLFEQGIAKNYARLIEGRAGVPGNLANLANKLTGGMSPTIKQIADILPTTEDIKGFTKKYGGEYLKEDEEGIGKIAGDFLTGVGSYSSGGGKIDLFDKANKGLAAYRFLNPLISPALGEGVKAITKAFGGSESSQELAAISTMIANDVLSNRGKGVNGYINQLYKEAEAALPLGTKINANSFFKALQSTKNKILMGGKDPTKEKALTQIAEIQKRISKQGNNYVIDPREFMEMRKSVNNTVDSLGGFGSELTHRGKKQAVEYLNDVRKDVIDAGMGYGNQHNPEFAKYWDAANEAYRVTAQSNAAMNFLNKLLPMKKLKSIFGVAGLGGTAGTVATKGVGASIAGAAKAAAVSAPFAAAGKITYDIGKIAYRAKKSPVLRKYYTNLFKAAAEKDAKVVGYYEDKIENELKKEEEKSTALMKKRFKK